MTFTPTPVHDLLLWGSGQVPVGLLHLHLATAEQLCRLHYSIGSLTTIKARLKILADNGYISANEAYKAPYYYTLDSKGIRYLRSNGHDLPAHLRGAKERDRQPLHVQHTLELNDVIIAAVLLGKQNEVYYLEKFIHERELKHPQYKYDVVPDALLDFRMRLADGKQRRMAVLLEHDRAHEHINAFKPRIKAYTKLLRNEAYKKLYGVGVVRIALVTLKGEQHIEKLREWTRQQLTATDDMEVSTYFYFKNLTPPLEPNALWLGSDWKTAYSDLAVGLLAG